MDSSVKKLSRREELDLWRQKTGRTPMKRLSYVQPCANPITPLVRMKGSHISHSYLDKNGRKELKHLQDHCLKGARQHHNVLTPFNEIVNRKENEDFCTPDNKKKRRNSIERAAMRELFQRDIDDTVAEILADGRVQEMAVESVSSSQSTALSSSGNIHKKLRKRRSSAFYVDSELAFQSSVIRYSTVASEHRRRNRHTNVGTPTTRLLYLTPVRRSTRRSRSICPEHAFGGELCFDSPSQAQNEEGYDRIEVIPNDALVIT